MANRYWFTIASKDGRKRGGRIGEVVQDKCLDDADAMEMAAEWFESENLGWRDEVRVTDIDDRLVGVVTSGD